MPAYGTVAAHFIGEDFGTSRFKGQLIVLYTIWRPRERGLIARRSLIRPSFQPFAEASAGTPCCGAAHPDRPPRGSDAPNALALLRVCSERPRERCSTEKRDELPSL